MCYLEIALILLLVISANK
uniref:Uncharacterized protein n=1 Tax=Rhizophora mucronata TaxID=61149 RepID=A0A2P2NQI7_RHIMU